MNQIEKEEISRLPEKYRPLSAWAYFGYGILFSLPVVGFILTIVFSLTNGNVNRKNYARSFLCALVLLIIVYIVLALCGYHFDVNTAA